MNKVFSIIFVFSSLLFSQKYGTWSNADSLIIPRETAASVVLDNGNLLVSGGIDSAYIKEVEIYYYNKGNGVWEITTPMLFERCGHVLKKLLDGRVLAIGGNYYNKTCEIFNIKKESWSLTDSMKTKRTYGYTATLLNNGDVLVIAGFYQTVGVSKYLDSNEIYSIVDSCWHQVDTTFKPRANHTATKLKDGRVLITGGFNNTDKELAECEIYNPDTKKWSLAAPLNKARCNHSATMLKDGKVLVTGGQNYLNPTDPWLNSCELYDPEKDAWVDVNPLKYAHTHHNPVLLNNGLLLIAGGGFGSDVWELYNPDNFTNVFGGKYPYRQAEQLINLLPNGKVLSSGGITWTDSNGMFIRSHERACYIYDFYGIDDISQELKNTISGFKLYQNYPNPFNPKTEIKYQIPYSCHVVLKIYNILGKEISTLVNNFQPSGIYTVSFDSRNLPSGIYFYQIITEKGVQSGKMVLSK